MTPGARAAAAIAVLDDWLAGQAAERALTNWARAARYAGAKDRAAVRDLVFDVLRARGSCARLGGGDDGRALILGLARLQGRAPETLFTGGAYGAASLSEREAVIHADPDALDPRADVPEWLLDHLAQRMGDDLHDLLAAMRGRAPLYLRVNTRRVTRADCIAALAAEGVVAEAEPSADTALAVRAGARKVRATAAYRDGLVEPQDLSVQRAVLAVDWPRGPILDYCAGGGGKALAIAALTGLPITAHDAAPQRMVDLPPRAARAGAAVTIVDGAALARAGVFEAVLCDVPCSGSGTWRRDPEGKWRLTPARLLALTRLQAEILDAAAAHVGPGGRLVYMTCSLFPVENELQVAAFLARHPGWRCVAEGCDTPLSASDGFYHAVLCAT